MADDIRSIIEGAIANASDGGAGAGDGGAASESAAAGPGADSSVESVGVAADAGPAEGGVDGRPADGGDGRARDASGKFVKGETDKTPVPKAAKPTVTVKPTVKPGAQTATAAPEAGAQAVAGPKYKPPQAWTPAAREKWGALPEDVQAEVDRWNREVMKTMQEAAKPREFHSSFREATAPYAAMMGSDPVKYTRELLHTAYTLQTAPPAQKAAILAKLVQDNAIPIEALDQALSGQAPTAAGMSGIDPETLAQQIEERVTKRFEQQQQQRRRESVEREIADFGSKNEFFEDVGPDVYAIIEAGRARGVAIHLKDAYNRALLVHRADPDSEIGKVLRERASKEAAKATVASTQQARNAASSVKSQPAVGTPTNGAKDIRSTIEASIAALSGR